MIKVVLAGLTLGVLSLATPSYALSQGMQKQEDPRRFPIPGSVINNIEVPHDVLMDVQVNFQGYAVTHVEKTSRNGATVYQLRVDRDDQPGTYDGFYLLFDANWQFITRGAQVTAPPPKPAPVAEPVPTEVPNVEAEEPEELEEVYEDIEGEGRGGGFEEDEEPDTNRNNRDEVPDTEEVN